VSVSFVSKTRPYAPEDKGYRASTAPAWRRTVASALDWFLVFVLFILASYPLGMIQTVGRTLGGAPGDAINGVTQALGLGVIVAYFAWFFATGHTLGMRALDIHVFGYGSGRDPHWARALVRSVLSAGFFLASVDAYGLSTGGYRGSGALSHVQADWRAAAVTGAAVAFLGAAWLLVDSEGRSIWDRFFGLVVVEDIVPATMPDRLWTPWGV
jgi:uncharacterized RDD family membrane protein YckC